MRTLGAILLATACGQERVPPVCADMCLSATVLYGSCIQEWEISFEEVGYASAQSFRESCETWAWQRSFFEEEALEEGLLAEKGWLEDTCGEGLALFDAPESNCQDYFSFDWTQVPGREDSP